MREELGSVSEEGYSKDYDRRCRKSSNYKINIDIADCYGRMYVGEVLDWIADIEYFFQYLEIPQDKRIKLVSFKLRGATFA